MTEHAADWGTSDQVRVVVVVSDDAGHMVISDPAWADWEVASGNPALAFLPALWPDDDRAWVPDPHVRTQRVSCNNGPSGTQPWCDADYEDWESDQAQVCRNAGVTPSPPGRVWLLRGPHGRSVAEIEDLILDCQPTTLGPSDTLRSVAEGVIRYAWQAQLS